MYVISFAILGLAIWIFTKFGSRFWQRNALILVAVIICVLTVLEIGVGQITGEGLNDSVFIHLQAGLSGGDFTQYKWTIFAGFIFLTIVSLVLIRLRHLISPGKEKATNWIEITIGILVLTAIISHPASFAVMNYYMRFSNVEVFRDGFYEPQPSVVQDISQKNLVLIYLESVERTYFDEQRFPDLINGLRALEQKSVSFTNMTQTVGSGFTIGGMVSSQCGTPLILSGGANSMRVSRFLNGATCLGDILSDAGYKLSYLGGASLEFAGKGAFYRSHGYDEVMGLDELRPVLTDKTYLAEWGLQDDTLLELAQLRLNSLSKTNTPFVLTLLTLDTHHPNGHGETNKSCQDVKYQDGKIPILDSVKCTDVLISNFIEDILAGPLARNTVVAVVSDHLALENGATDLLESGPRRNLFFALQPDGTRQEVNRLATTLDVGPTLLSMVGIVVPRMGFGVDLQGDHPTLNEKLGLSIHDRDEMNRHLMGYQTVYTHLWDYPDLSDGIYTNVEQGTVHFGEFEYKMPALFTLDSDYAVVQATLGDIRSEENIPETMLEMLEGTRFMWFEDCHALTPLARTQLPTVRKSFCVAYGRRSIAVDVSTIERSTYFSEDVLKNFLSAETRDDSNFIENNALEKIGRKMGDLPIRLMYPELALNNGGVLIQSAGFGAGPAFVRPQGNDSIATGQDLLLENGVNLVGIQSNGNAKLIARLDQCSLDFQANSLTSWTKLIEAGMEYAAHLVVVHDTAYCGNSIEPLSKALDGMLLPVLKALEMRQPYIGIINRQGQVWEFENKRFPKIKVLLDPLLGEYHPSHNLAELNDGAAIANGDLFNAEITNSHIGYDVAISVDTLTEVDPELGEPIGECHRPRPTVALGVPENSIPISETLSGVDLSRIITFGKGWWALESAGRWSGAEIAEIAILLPMFKSKRLDLIFNFATSDSVSKDLKVFYGLELLAQLQIEGETEIRLDVTKLPRNVPVNIKFVTSANTLTCPRSLGAGMDSRLLNFMMKSVHATITSEISIPTELDNSINAVDASPPDFVEKQPIEGTNNQCVQPKEVFWEDQTISALQPNEVYSVFEAINQNLVSFGSGWWDIEQYGRWIGASKADIKIVLPFEPIRLQLSLETASFPKSVGQMALVHDGRLLGIRSTGANNPFEVDVSELPRGQKITLSFYTNFDGGTCPMENGLGDDQRKLSVMIRSFSLSSVIREILSPTIAHGAGRLDGIAISNSFDALQANLEKFEIFEIDFSWTSDGELICLHDWTESFRSRFGAATDKPIEIHDFRSLLAQSIDLPRNCELEGLAGWMRANPRKLVVTDVKSDAIRAHELIASRHPDLLDQFIPQAYQPVEIDRYRELGFGEIIWSLYRFGGSDNDVVTEVSVHRPTAVAMSKSRSDSGLLEELRQQFSIEVFVHTINDPMEAGCLKARGATGIYSDDLGANSWKSLKPTLSTCLNLVPGK